MGQRDVIDGDVAGVVCSLHALKHNAVGGLGVDVNLGHHPVVAVVASLVEDLVGCGPVLQVHVEAASAFTNNETLHSTKVQQYSAHTHQFPQSTILVK